MEIIKSMEEKKSREGKRVIYLKKEKEENIWKRKKMKLFGDGTYLVGIGGEERRMREEKIFGKYSWWVEGLKVILKAASDRKGYA